VSNKDVPEVDAGSFRDPAGQVLHHQGRVFRTVSDFGWNHFEPVWQSGLIADLATEDLVLPLNEVDQATAGNPDHAARVFETKKLDFVSWPFEWSFSALKAAALLHLDVHLKALERGFTLSDASAYNVQFRGARPVFIDHLSFRPYEEGEIWTGHRQFCEQFINPLVLAAKAGVMPNAWYRGAQEGLPTADVARLIPLRSKFSWSVFMHLVMQARLDRAAVSGAGDIDTKAMSRAKLPKSSLLNMLKGLQHWIAGLKPPERATVWRDYAADNSYAEAEAREKKRLVTEMVADVKPGLVLDLGCNSGDYSVVALEAGARQVVGFDVDFGALEAAFSRSQTQNLNFLPLHFDAANPSPDQGWAQMERAGFDRRARADVLLALAFVHHLAIARNISLPQLLNWLIDRAPEGLIEFVPKEDAMVQRLLALREDIFENYSAETFLAAIRTRADIVQDVQVSESGRRLIRYRRRPERE
jgi:ribosomal protein L11 methylase PrmA